MPIFEYVCRHCGQTMEKIQRRPQAEITCASCGEKAVRAVSLTATASSESGGCGSPAGGGFT